MYPDRVEDRPKSWCEYCFELKKPETLEGTKLSHAWNRTCVSIAFHWSIVYCVQWERCENFNKILIRKPLN